MTISALNQTFPTPYAGVNATYWTIGGYTEDFVSSGAITLNGYLDSAHAVAPPLASYSYAISGAAYTPNMTTDQLYAFILTRPEWSGATTL